MRFSLIFTFSCLLLISCLEEVKVPIRQNSEALVVEGFLSNEIGNHFLRLSLTTQFGDVNTIVPLSGAYVEIRGKDINPVRFRPNPNEIGVYELADKNFVGVVGKSYQLYIKLPDGRSFASIAETMPVAVPIEEIKSKPIQEKNVGFLVDVALKDPQETTNYYRWTAHGYHGRRATGVQVGFESRCCTNCWVRKDETAINILTDANLNGQKISNPVFFSPFYTTGKHFVEVTQRNISRNAYQFWKRYREQQVRSGTIFDPLPAPLLGNVVNTEDSQDIALGYFEIMAISKKRLVIVDGSLDKVAVNFNNSIYIPEGDCMLAFPFSSYSSTPTPLGW